MSKIKKFVKKLVPETLLKLRRDYLLEQQRKRFHSGCKELLFKVDDILVTSPPSVVITILFFAIFPALSA